jgi:hypothetical protein
MSIDARIEAIRKKNQRPPNEIAKKPIIKAP